MKALSQSFRHARLGCRSLASAAGTPMVMKAEVEAYAEGATTLVSADKYKFVVDEAPRMGGQGIGPNPLSTLLGSLIGCTQYTASMVANEMKLGNLGSAAWAAAGEYNLQGVRGDQDADARFTRIALQGTFETDLSQQDLDAIARQMEKRCIIAATLKASGADLDLSFKKGAVDHQCGPACALHELQQQGGVTGQVKGDPGRDADAPQFKGTAGQGPASARAYCTHARRTFFTSPAWSRAKDGEDVARENMQADVTPQLQKERSEQGSDRTAGSAYAERDDPRQQASPPVEGKSDRQIVQEQTAGKTVSPKEAGAHAEGGKSMDPGKSASPRYADRASKGKSGESPLGNRPAGDE